jgi:hypothetical protein
VIVYFGQFSKHFWAPLFLGQGYASILTKKMDWATFWATFSQTHLVTLFLSSSES